MAGSSSITSTLPLEIAASTSRGGASDGIDKLPGRRFHLKPGEFQVEQRAARARIGNLDRAAVFLDDAIGDGEAQARAFARGLGRKERVVNAVEVFGGNAGARIADIHAGAGLLAPRAYGERAAALHGVTRIQEQVQEDLLQLAGI